MTKENGRPARNDPASRPIIHSRRARRSPTAAETAALRSITGIVSSTCNYILSGMEHGVSFAKALQGAREKGFAEADATLDVEGIDAAQKLRLIGEVYRAASGVELCVEPRELRCDDLLASARDETNAVRISGRAFGELVLIGKGAGAMPTATAVLSDVISLCV